MQAEDDLAILLREICGKPGMFLGRVSLPALSHFLNGYATALGRIGICEDVMSGWQRWIEFEFLISHTAWHWTRILRHEYGTESAAFDAIPNLFDRFLAVRREQGGDWIEEELSRRMQETHGNLYYCPDKTETPDNWLCEFPSCLTSEDRV